MALEAFAFSKVIPGGNPTIILHGGQGFGASLPLGELSARLMAPLHLCAEQVGVLWDDARLEMMGGEFCVNATRAAAVLLALDGLLACGGEYYYGSLAVSGAGERVPVLVCRDAAAARRAAADMDAAKPGQGAPQADGASGMTADELRHAYCAALLPCAAPGVEVEDKGEGACLVRMPGMAHLLLDMGVHAFPGYEGEAWRGAAYTWRERTGLLEEEASGVVWYAPLAEGPGDVRIYPSVFVRASRSEHLETACGSATLALAVLMGRETGMAPLSVLQPGGQCLDVFPAPPGHNGQAHQMGQNGQTAQAWVGSRVLVAARGTAYVDTNF